MNKKKKIIEHLIKTHNRLMNLCSANYSINLLERRHSSVLESIDKIIIGQMLSKQAATSIINKADHLCKTLEIDYISDLSLKSLRECGVSNSKVKAMKSFNKTYRKDINNIEGWANLPYASLRIEINKYWGLSDWSAQMIAIFHFGNEDVFPHHDGSIKRAIQILEKKRIKIQPKKASPYNSYLALYIWHLLDNNII